MIWTDAPCRTTCWNGGNDTEDAFRSPQAGMHHRRSIRGWKTTASLPTSFCPPTPTWKWTISSPTCGRAAVCRCHDCAKRPSNQLANPRAILRSWWRWPRSSDLEKKVTEADHRRHAEEGLRLHGPGEVHDLGGISRRRSTTSTRVAEDWEKDVAGIQQVPRRSGKESRCGTPSRKLEFYSERLAKHFPDDKERPPSPQVGGEERDA